VINDVVVVLINKKSCRKRSGGTSQYPEYFEKKLLLKHVFANSLGVLD
jgi:hypothetical protein